MKRRRAEGLPHSIQARLRAKAETEGRPFAGLLDLYGIERFLHRLATSRYGDRFVLKGALLIRHWLGTDTRPTRDVDLMGPAELDSGLVRQGSSTSPWPKSRHMALTRSWPRSWRPWSRSATPIAG